MVVFWCIVFFLGVGGGHWIWGPFFFLLHFVGFKLKLGGFYFSFVFFFIGVGGLCLVGPSGVFKKN
jgi:hypothetical protein